MSMNRAGSSFGSALLALLVGLVVGLTIGHVRRYPRGAADPEPAAGGTAVAVQMRGPGVRGQGPAIARAARRGLRLLSRVDRVAWGGVWALSVLVIAAYLLTSFSQAGPRQFTPAVGSLSLDTPEAGTADLGGELREMAGRTEARPQVAEAARDPAAGAPAAAPTPTPAPSPSPTPSPTPELPACALQGDRDCNCADFATQAEAQTFYERFPPGDPHRMDIDLDGIACEKLLGS